MATGRVTAAALNLRASPGGVVTGVLRQNCILQISEHSNGWLNVTATQDNAVISGWVSAAFVAEDAGAPAPAVPSAAAALPSATPATPAQPTALPVGDDAEHPITMQGNQAIGPGAVFFAQFQHQGGFFSSGLTPLTAWLSQSGTSAHFSPSVVRVLQAVSDNEGHLEAVNSYDNAFLSFGMQQWTIGTGNEPGELPALLDLLRQRDTVAFDECFGRYGIGLELRPPVPGFVRTGFLTLNGAAIATTEAKQAMRGAEWAYRFWRAGHSDALRLCQAILAAERIEVARARPVRNLPASAWLTSEHGTAILLDEHVNAPGHVPQTLATAVEEMIAAGTAPNPQDWGNEQEAELVRRYVAVRNNSAMNDPDGRAKRIAAAVLRGVLSDARGSFVP